MKKLILTLSLILLSQSLAFSKEVTLECSCVVQFTDMYVKYEPMTLTDKGIVKVKNKNVGSFAPAPDNAMFGTLNGNTFCYDSEKGLFIRSNNIDGKNIPCYGSCKLVK